jgi:hypothetical protein
MAPLDALTTARIRSLERVLAWLIEQSLDAPNPVFTEVAMEPTYILDLAESISEAAEEDG